MSDSLVTAVTTILAAIIGLAIITVLVSNHSQTGSVLKSGGSAFASILNAATGNSSGGGLSLPNLGG